MAHINSRWDFFKKLALAAGIVTVAPALLKKPEDDYIMGIKRSGEVSFPKVSFLASGGFNIADSSAGERWRGDTTWLS